MNHLWFLLLMFLPDVTSPLWVVTTPKLVTASRGSCVLLPCSFSPLPQYVHGTAKWLKGDGPKAELVIESSRESDLSFRGQAKLHAGWKKDGVCTLTIQNLTEQDVGWYFFQIFNTYGKIVSKADGVLLNISAMSMLPIISSPGEIRAGTKVSLYCSLRYTCPSSLWWKGPDGVLVDPASDTDMATGTNRISVTLVPSSLDHGKRWTCGHSSYQGQPVTQSVTLNVLYAPTFAHVTLSPFTKIHHQQMVTLRCGVGDSNPPVTSFKWHRTSNYYPTILSKTDTISLTHYQTKGDHWCEARNSIGTITSNKTKLPVYGKFVWAVWTPLSLRARLGSCMVIPCQFQMPRISQSRIKGIWLKGHHYTGEMVISTASESFGDHEGHAEFLGDLENGNCSLKIQDVRTSDAGVYHFRIEADEKWSDPIGFQLLVPGRSERPVITVPATVVVGKMASLTCSVSSHCPEDKAELEWFHPDIQGVPQMSRRTEDHHWVHTSTVSLRPTFHNRQQKVRCSARFGTRTETADSEVALNVNYPPQNVNISVTISRQRFPPGLTEGDAITLTCMYEEADPSVQWYKWYTDGQELSHRSNVINFNSLTYTDFGTYSCEATNSLGSSSSTKLLVTGKYQPRHVHIKPSVNGVELGNPVTMWEGARLTLKCESEGSHPPVSSYSWYRHETLLWDRETEVLNVTRQHSGTYWCQSANQVGSGRSPTLTINVQYPPTNVRITGLSVARVGQTVTMSCQCEANPECDTYTWSKACGSQITKLSQTGRKYHLRVSMSNVSCQYRCQAGNTIQEQESPLFPLDVHYPPTNVRITGLSVARVGQTVTMSCQCEANPECDSYTWSKACGSQITKLSQTGRKYHLRVSMSDVSCQYRCQAGNTIQEKESPLFPLDVHYSPSDIRVQAPSEVVEGERVVLSCLSSGNPPADRYQWRKRCGERVEWLEGTTSEIQVTVPSGDGQCRYSCIVRNAVGHSESPSKHITIK